MMVLSGCAWMTSKSILLSYLSVNSKTTMFSIILDSIWTYNKIGISLMLPFPHKVNTHSVFLRLIPDASLFQQTINIQVSAFKLSRIMEIPLSMSKEKVDIWTVILMLLVPLYLQEIIKCL